MGAIPYSTMSKVEIDTNLPPYYEFYVQPRSLYILQGPLRYRYAHAILGPDCMPLSRLPVLPVEARVSIMFRDAL